ncbi:MAG: hypothetical protein IJ111_06190 [Eggerthellaceae bacterium]|nr:hypothetical protein [Eggerthellaceae bacterium]
MVSIEQTSLDYLFKRVQGKHKTGDVILCDACGEPIRVWKKIPGHDFVAPCYEPCKCERSRKTTADIMSKQNKLRSVGRIGVLLNSGGFFHEGNQVRSSFVDWEFDYSPDPVQYVRSGIGAFLSGGRSSGKSPTLQQALALFYLYGIKVAYFKHKDLIELCQSTMSSNSNVTMSQITNALSTCKVIAIDDFAGCYLSEWSVCKTLDILKDAVEKKTLLCIASRHDERTLRTALNKSKNSADEIIEILATSTRKYIPQR